jgi:hypothetical protein
MLDVRSDDQGRYVQSGTVMCTEALAYGAVEIASLCGVIDGGTIWYPPGALDGLPE